MLANVNFSGSGDKATEMKENLSTLWRWLRTVWKASGLAHGCAFKLVSVGQPGSGNDARELEARYLAW